MTLPRGAADALRVGGGDINQAWKVKLQDGRFAFVKTRPQARQGEYAREAESLRWLEEPHALQVPQVIEVSEDYLALSWIEQGTLHAKGAEELGTGLARLHAAGAPCFGDWTRGQASAPAPTSAGDPAQTLAPTSAGDPAQTRAPTSAGDLAQAPAAAAVIGSLALPNEPLQDWPSFYVQRRLLPALEAASAAAAISPRGVATVRALCDRIGDFAGPPQPPARLHGDLWSGNVIAGVDGRPWLIDPTAYGGHREVDLAMLRLFGAPSERVFHAYAEVFPLAEGWQERVRLWQLLPILVHAALFGGSYGREAERIAAFYAG